ncbi:MAG TPA: MarR family transcriptional regulator, partial [Kofleriaceae bacterium]|nr:MarR family transcriptional regulator [Kofleriaceae bacterium]
MRVIREGSRGGERVGGISGAQVFVMHCLLGSGPLTISELAGRTMTHQSSVSVVVQRLVDRGLVTRGIADGDRRRREVALTAAGRRLLRRTPDAAQTRLLGAIARMPRRAREQLAESLVALVHAMGADREPAEMFFEDGRGDGQGDGPA